MVRALGIRRLVAVMLAAVAATPSEGQVAILPLVGDDDGAARVALAGVLERDGLWVRLVEPGDGSYGEPAQAVVGGSLLRAPDPPDGGLVAGGGAGWVGLQLEVTRAGDSELRVVDMVWAAAADQPSSVACVCSLAKGPLADAAGLTSPWNAPGGPLAVARLLLIHPLAGSAVGLALLALGGATLISGYLSPGKERAQLRRWEPLQSEYERQLEHPVYGEVAKIMARSFARHIETIAGEGEPGGVAVNELYQRQGAGWPSVSRWLAKRRFRQACRRLKPGGLVAATEAEAWGLHRQLSRILEDLGVPGPLLEMPDNAR